MTKIKGMLLTSGGLTNSLLLHTFRQKTQKSGSNVKVAAIITAALGEQGDKQWLLKDLACIYDAGAAELDIVDIAHPKDEWIQKLEWADVIWVEGGDTKFLMHHVQTSGLVADLPRLLENRLYVGISAGSMIMGHCLPAGVEEEFYTDVMYTEPYSRIASYLGWVPMYIVPHFSTESRNESLLKSLAGVVKYPVYGLDDQSALLVEAGKTAVISDGNWKVFEK